VIAIVVASLTSLGTSFAGPDGEPQACPASHEVRTIEGWTVRFDARLFADQNQATGRIAERLLAAKLLEISMIVPETRLSRLREVPIWVDLSHGALERMQYHPSSDWLRANGYPETLAKCVHIPRAALFVDAEHNHAQPWAVLHELAHAYHDRELGFDEPRIVAAYERFRDADRTRSVLHVSGVNREHYGRTNPMEFFAELTESYFGANDFYPFVRGELQQDQPDACALLEEIWGVRSGE
jgi:hypothetical protein